MKPATLEITLTNKQKRSKLMTTQTITALFDSRSDASKAVEQLATAGIQRNRIRMLPDREIQGGTATRSSYDYQKDEGGFWASLRDIFLPNDDRATYAEGMHRGGTTVVVTAEDTQAQRASDILEASGAVDVNERESAWRKEGWAGYSATTPMGGVSGSRSAETFGQTASQEETQRIPVVEEELRVGKRQVDHGRVRVRSYTVETPVEEQVNLRNERVTVERRRVDRPLSETEAPGMFQDHTVEMEERGEEAVIGKDARVKEELVVGKTADQRTEKVSDKVRHTEVEVEDERLDRTPARNTKSGRDPL
jgi:stress response protein YsnF